MRRSAASTAATHELGLITGRSELCQVPQNPLVLGVELETLVVADRPDRADQLPTDVEWDEQRLDDRGLDVREVREVALRVGHQHRAASVEHGPAGTEFARRGVPATWGKLTGESVPAEHRLAFLEEADSGRAGVTQRQRRIRQVLKDVLGRIRQVPRERDQGQVFSFELGCPRRPQIQFAGDDQRLQADPAARRHGWIHLHDPLADALPPRRRHAYR